MFSEKKTDKDIDMLNAIASLSVCFIQLFNEKNSTRFKVCDLKTVHFSLGNYYELNSDN